MFISYSTGWGFGTGGCITTCGKIRPTNQSESKTLSIEWQAQYSGLTVRLLGSELIAFAPTTPDNTRVHRP